MMPFYYGSKVRSVPEFLLRRFGPATHLVNGVSFAIAQCSSRASTSTRWHRGQPAAWLAAVLSIVVAAAIVLAYTTLVACPRPSTTR